MCTCSQDEAQHDGDRPRTFRRHRAQCWRSHKLTRPSADTIHEILSVAFPFYFLIEKFNSLLNRLDMWKSTSFYKQNEYIYSSVVYKPLNYNGRAFVASRQFRVIVKAEDHKSFKYLVVYNMIVHLPLPMGQKCLVWSFCADCGF